MEFSEQQQEHFYRHLKQFEPLHCQVCGANEWDGGMRAYRLHPFIDEDEDQPQVIVLADLRCRRCKQVLFFDANALELLR